MRKLPLLFILLFLTTAVFAQDFPSPTGHVNDFAGVLDTQSRTDLESRLTWFEQNMSVEIAVVTVPSLEGTDVDSYAVALFEKWGIGKKGKDDGLLLLVAPNEKKWRIEVGYGLEGLINDAKAGRIGRDVMVPYFKEGNFSEGIKSGVEAIISVLEGKEEVLSTDNRAEGFLMASIMPLFFFHMVLCWICFGTYRYYTEKKKKKYPLLAVPWILVIVILVMSWILGLVFAVFTLVHLASAFSKGKGGFGGMGGTGGWGGGSSGGFGGFGGGGSGGGGASGGW